MSRYIDADKLKAELQESAEWHEERRVGYYSAITHINEQPTAYDVEVVINNLLANKEEVKGIGEVIRIDTVIEIVRGENYE